MIPVARSPYDLQARDSVGAVRATLNGIVLIGHGDQISRDITLSGIGSVLGTVSNPDGSPAPGTGVTLSSQVPGMPNRFTTTDGDGNYRIDAIPVGGLSVSASIPVLRFGGSSSGSITSEGDQISVDIHLRENQIPASTATLVRLFDANNFGFAIQQSGEIRDGKTAVFSGDGGVNRGGMRLDILQNELATPFAGSGGSFEDNGREIAIPGSGPAGLQVTRKVYVPLNGYFARYLEILTNPTATAISLDLRVDSHYRYIQQTRDGFRFNEPPRVISTSDGDGFLFSGDRWAVVDDNTDADPFESGNLPSVAQVFDGIGALAAAVRSISTPPAFTAVYSPIPVAHLPSWMCLSATILWVRVKPLPVCAVAPQ